VQRVLGGIVVACLLAGCTRSSSSGGTLASAAPGSTAAVNSNATASSARIALLDRGLSIDGKVVPLIGGEIHYFRTRDPNWDVAKTWQLWEQTLDQAMACGINLVATYVPWDFHEEVEGNLDFTGVRDVGHFLELCYQRGLKVAFKPGPFIQGEWPYGSSSFGGVPYWWKTKHPGSLALQPNGQPFNFDDYGAGPNGVQPSFFSPDYRAACAHWIAALAPIVKTYVHDRPTIAMIQLDDETNFYYHSRFSSDYGPYGVAQYQAWLAGRYSSIAALNSAYGTNHASFQAVTPPSAEPASLKDNLPVQDWFQAGKDGVAEYQKALRALWEAQGVQEPSVLFTTNDAPMPMADLQLWDGPTKNEAGLSTLDAYPKQFPYTFDRPADYPFLSSLWTKLFIESNQDYSFAGGAPRKIHGGFAAELQGGFFQYPFNIPLEIPPHTTDLGLAEFYGHGGVFGSIYMFRGGLNRDGSIYYPMAALDENGAATPRYALIQRFAKNVLAGHGAELLASAEVEAKVALVVGTQFDAPAFGVEGTPGGIQQEEAPGVYGWLEDAGLEPHVLDARRIKRGDLDAFQLVVYVNPDAAPDAFADALDDYVQRGGSVLNVLHKGEFDASWGSKGAAPALLANGLFSDGTLLSTYEDSVADMLGEYAPIAQLVGVYYPPEINFALPGGVTGNMATSPFMGFYALGSNATVLVHERTDPSGTDGRASGWFAARGKGQVFFLGTSPGRPFRDFFYYDVSTTELASARALASWIGGQAGASPVLSVQDAKARAFARRIDASQGGGLLVFLASRLAANNTATLQLLDLPSLGLNAGQTYTVTELLGNVSLGSATGAQLASGIAVPIEAYGPAVLLVK